MCLAHHLLPSLATNVLFSFTTFSQSRSAATVCVLPLTSLPSLPWIGGGCPSLFCRLPVCCCYLVLSLPPCCLIGWQPNQECLFLFFTSHAAELDLPITITVIHFTELAWLTKDDHDPYPLLPILVHARVDATTSCGLSSPASANSAAIFAVKSFICVW
jgi:hypothetical protein